jgi:hypothetical protein
MPRRNELVVGKRDDTLAGRGRDVARGAGDIQPKTPTQHREPSRSPHGSTRAHLRPDAAPDHNALPPSSLSYTAEL